MAMDESLPEFNASMMYLYRLSQIQQRCIECLTDQEEFGHPYNSLMALYVELYPRMTKDMKIESKKLFEQQRDYWIVYRTLNLYAHELGLIMKDQDDAARAFRGGR